MNKPDWKHWSSERLSTTVLYAMVVLTAIVFVLFWFVGYDRPYADDPNFNAPLFTDALLGLITLILVAALFFSGWSVYRALKVRGRGERMVNNIPVKKIGYSIIIGVAALLIVTFALGSSKPMTINGILFDGTFWLKTADMLINTTLILILVATGAIIFGATRYYRKKP
ncbi:MAG: hypothetical protein ACOYJF_04365 [Prevotella sp.]|jgi:heme/copper-type cytochrome/quinol oxidase subunit 2